MITGVVTAEREAIIRVILRGPTGQELEIEAVIDTGFDGWLFLSMELTSLLLLPWRGRGRALLADGSESIFDIYEAMIMWDEQPRRIRVDAAETAPLVGMAMLEGCELNMKIVADGPVSIRALENSP